MVLIQTWCIRGFESPFWNMKTKYLKWLIIVVLLISSEGTAKTERGTDRYNKSFEVVNTLLRIRRLYPPTIEGRRKAWSDYQKGKRTKAWVDTTSSCD